MIGWPSGASAAPRDHGWSVETRAGQADAYVAVIERPGANL